MTTEQIDLQKRVKEIRERAEKAMHERLGSSPGLTIAICRQDIPWLLDQLALEQKRVKELEAEFNTKSEAGMILARQLEIRRAAHDEIYTRFIAREAELQQLRAELADTHGVEIQRQIDALRAERDELRRALEALEAVSHVEGFTYDAIQKARAVLNPEKESNATPGSPAL